MTELVARKGATTVSACVPALNEEGTIGPVVQTLVRLRDAGLVDEVLVVDSGSVDRTREMARDAGAEVVLDYEVLPELGRAEGKGEAIFKGIAATSGDVICLVDADITDFTERFVVGLVGPLIEDPSLLFVKAYYQRPLAEGPTTGAQGESASDQARMQPRIGEGGRVTELTARPLLSHLFPSVAAFTQPLSGEYAARRWVLERISLDTGYGVDVGILIDVYALAGEDRVAECDLEIRHHRNRPLYELAPMAAEVSYAILRRAPGFEPPLGELDAQATYAGLYGRDLRIGRRPPLASLDLVT